MYYEESKIVICLDSFSKQIYNIWVFLAHLSRRLKDELIVYRSIRRPCVRASVRASIRG